jgi:hypothetical protein
LQWVRLPTKKKSQQNADLGNTLLKHGRHFDYWNQPMNMSMHVCYLDCHEAGLCYYLVIHIETLLRPLRVIHFHLWPIYWLSFVKYRSGIYQFCGPGFVTHQGRMISNFIYTYKCLCKLLNLSNSMVVIPYWEAASRSSIKEFPNILWNLKVRYPCWQEPFTGPQSWARWIQSTSPHLISLRFVLTNTFSV